MFKSDVGEGWVETAKRLVEDWGLLAMVVLPLGLPPAALVAGVDVETHAHAVRVAIIFRNLAFTIREMITKTLRKECHVWEYWNLPILQEITFC